jgi:hypothetical protein
MKSMMPTRDKLDSRLIVMLPESLKRQLFADAARKGRPAADLVRDAIAGAVGAH